MSAVRTSFLVAGLLIVSGCKKDAEPVAVAPKPVAMPTAPAAPAAGGLVGTVAEKIEAANYSYLRITNAGGDTWAAVPTSPVAVGATVRIVNPMPMKNFESKTLGRTFELVMFASAAQEVGAEGATAAPAPAPAANPHAGAAPAPAGDAAPIQVAKATAADGRTVSEVYTQRTQLAGQTATVHAKVVKVTNGVMGKNWAHLRDGSGTDAAQDNDLIVTTTDTVGVGDVVNASGKVTIDKDLGSGYSYKVLIEDAKVAAAP